MKMYLKIEDDVIKDVKFKTFGCGAAVATSSMATETDQRKTVEEALKVTNKAVAEALDGFRRSRCIALFWRKMQSVPLSRIITNVRELIRFRSSVASVIVMHAMPSMGTNCNSNKKNSAPHFIPGVQSFSL
jgi:hypothetical protein